MNGGSGGGLLDGLFARGASAQVTSDDALLQAMLDVELGLMWALVTCGLAPPEAAEELAAVSDASLYDLAQIGAQAGEQGTPVPGMLSALRQRLPEVAQSHLHMGATSQDVLDSALMLLARRALAPLVADLQRAAGACAELAAAHRRTLLPGRTLLQQALPTTFALKAAGWLSALGESERELTEVREHVLAVQLGGAVGTLAALGDRGLDVAAALAGELGLAAPSLPWHTVRTRPARLAGALGSALGVMAKIARDLVLLAQTEVAEVREGGEGGGGSSTMPHKRNPVGAVAVLACAGQAPGLVASVFAAMDQEHERAAGAWQSEWEPLRALLRLAGSAADALAGTLADLELDAVRMRADLELTGAAVMSESVVTALTAALGRTRAQELVRDAARRAADEERPMDAVLLEQAEIVGTLGEEGLRRALDPEHYLGLSDRLVELALARHADRAAG